MSKTEIAFYIVMLAVQSVLSYLYFKEKALRKKYQSLSYKYMVKYQLMLYKYLTLDTYKIIHSIKRYADTLQRLRKEKPIE